MGRAKVNREPCLKSLLIEARAESKVNAKIASRVDGAFFIACHVTMPQRLLHMLTTACHVTDAIKSYVICVSQKSAINAIVLAENTRKATLTSNRVFTRTNELKPLK